ncbi:hypothetical protein HQN86_12695 [Pedobacter panaciterrae]|uniref:hypothetical protein n=1 Tax=Pedobacter panaciterrae TaxID=363849 RepID=UPI00155DDD62|nr:hypothetical protein [Pedobacter panaciterrae]NQX54475.1 hypothetical protein [Pedobacter panaciterrae]
MFRKIHSKRDPSDTLYSALAREFRAYIDWLKAKIRGLLKAYPKPVFAFMVVSIIVSASLAVTVFRSEKPTSVPQIKPAVSTVGKGFSQILATADALRESLEIKREISALIAKDSLSSADSVLLEKALNRFHQLTITTNSNEPN